MLISEEFLAWLNEGLETVGVGSRVRDCPKWLRLSFREYQRGVRGEARELAQKIKHHRRGGEVPPYELLEVGQGYIQEWIYEGHKVSMRGFFARLGQYSRRKGKTFKRGFSAITEGVEIIRIS